MAETQNPRAPHPVDIHVGHRVRVRRTLNGLSQTTLAEALGLTFQQLQKYESGANRVSASRLWAISNVLDVPIAWFFAGIDDGEDRLEEIETKRETLELVRNFNHCPPELRRPFQALLHQMAKQFGRNDRPGRAPGRPRRSASGSKNRQSVPK